MKMMPVAAACGLWILTAGSVLAQTVAGGGNAPVAPVPAEPPVVVEFFTSQGCSSCPPADAVFGRLAADPGIIPLALHVDYWDYIGWSDSFADPAFTERQKAYARAIGSRTIYTPQMIVSGMIRVEGNKPDDLAEAIARERQEAAERSMSPLPGPVLQVSREPEGLRIRASVPEPGMSFASPAARHPEAWVVQIVRYTPEQTVDITHGENAGQRVVYRNIVTDWQRVAEWPGQPPLDFIVPVTGEEPAVILLQRAGPGEIVAAARIGQN